MSAIRLLELLAAQGALLSVEGDKIEIDAPEGLLTPDTLATLRQHKADILALLQSKRSWSADDWRAFFRDRADAIESRRGLSRAEAEMAAFEWTIVRWLDAFPGPSNIHPDRCIGCGEATKNATIPVLRGDGGHTWLHPECWADWYRQRRQEAIAAFAAMGIKPPRDQPIRAA